VRERALWRVLPYLRPHRVRIALIVFSAVVSMACQIAIPFIAAKVIDGPIAEGDHAGVWPWFVASIVLAIVELVLNAHRRGSLSNLATQVETALRDDLYEHLQRLDIGFHDQWQSGQLLSRATSDLSLLRRFAGFASVFFVIISIQVIGIMTMLVRLDSLLALVVLLGMAPVVALCRLFVREYHDVVRRIQDQTGDLATTIEEGAKGIRVIRSFGRSKEMEDLYATRARLIYDTQIDRIRVHTKFMWVLGTVPNLVLIAIMLGGVLSVGSGRLTVGGLLAFVSYVLMLVWPVEALGWTIAIAEEAETAAGRLWEVFDTPPAITDRPGARSIERAAGALAFEHVVFRYPGTGHRVLDGLDLTIAAGETLALVGTTGSGKTTIATLLARLYDPDDGRITLDGTDLRDLTVTSLRRQIGFAFEEPTLFSASVLENLLIGKPDATDVEVDEALAIAQAGFAYELPWGLDTRIGEQGLSLSGGQRQRLALARAIVARPRVLVLDDPLSALDVHTEALVQDALRPILADSTALLVVHRPSTIALADRSALVRDGRIVAIGTHSDLMKGNADYRAVLSQEAEHLESGHLEADDLDIDLVEETSP
jgi:ATP-binding cassette, subfamily B, bacterial